MREYLPTLIGNKTLRERLGAEIQRGAFSHAYIIEGKSGSGKHTLAREIAMSLACEHRTDERYPLPCGTCPTCRKIAAGNSPDVITVRREEGKATFGVGTVRALREEVSILPNELDFKIYLIEDAHTMTTQAQNAFLLTLEEPPAFVIFLLLCNEADLLLETIRSRAPVLRMQPVDDTELSSYLLSPERADICHAAKSVQEENLEDYAALLRMADGRIGRALELLEENKRTPLLKCRRDALALCTILAKGKDSVSLMRLLRSFDGTREDITTKLLMIEQALRDLTVLCHSECAPLIFFTDREQAAELSVRFTAHELFELIAATDDALQALTANANKRLVITQYLCRISA